MDAVQRMREKAQEQGNLKIHRAAKGGDQSGGKQEVIVIEQANPQVIYVPSYNPVVVYGPPSILIRRSIIRPPGYYAAGMAISFGVGIGHGSRLCTAAGAMAAAGGTMTSTSTLTTTSTATPTSIEEQRQPGGGNNNWQHNPQHRGGAPYSDRATANKYRRDSARRFHDDAAGSARQQQPTKTPAAETRPVRWSRGCGAIGSHRGRFRGPRRRRRPRGQPQRFERRGISQFRRLRRIFRSAGAASSARSSSSRGIQFEAPAVAGRAAAAVGGGKPSHEQGKPDEFNNMARQSCGALSSHLALAALSGALAVTYASGPQAELKTQPPVPAAPKVFDTPQQAAEALIGAAERYDDAGALGDFRPRGQGFRPRGDPVQDKNTVPAFAAKAREKIAVNVDPKKLEPGHSDRRRQDWPFPVPLVKKGGNGISIPEAGHDEILYPAHRRAMSWTPSRSAGASSKLKTNTPRRSMMIPGSTSTHRRSSALPGNRMACIG